MSERPTFDAPDAVGLRLDVRRALPDFTLDVQLSAQREIVVLYGPSGSGKSMTLRTIAGLSRPDSGRIEIDGRTMFDAARRINVPPHQRGVGLVVQDYQLFPHLTIAQNAAFGLSALPRDQQERRVAALLELLRIAGLAERRPATISGGQAQRAALARALAVEPQLLLLDEPFAALDEDVRISLRSELSALTQRLGLTVVLVTHDLREAHLLADRIAVLDRGCVLQSGSRDEVFRLPRSRRIAELTGVRNVFHGVARADGAITVAGLALRVTEAAAWPDGTSLDVAIRAERCNLRRVDPDQPLPPNCFVATVTEDLPFGNAHTLRMAPERIGPSVEIEVASRPYEVLGVAGRMRWVVELPADDLHVMLADEANGASAQ